jgi:predicted transcriptional regulator
MIEELLTQSLKLNELAKKLDITATEAFRQLQRLTEAGLLEKNSDAKYSSTPYARLILESMAGTEFISKHKAYFLEHDVSFIPAPFRARFGELGKTIHLADPIPNMNTANDILKNADEFIYIIAEDHLVQHSLLIRERLLAGVKVRTLIKESLLESVKGEFVKRGEGEVRLAPKVFGTLILTDKSMGFALPNRGGTIDYQVIAGVDPESIRWGLDLFEDQWSKARPWNP